ncbi:MAG: 23S rRNA (adenine(2030)-N(6))-methyltransferase RlmJ [Hyphomicrobiales bacterium]|nr:23S rRNA (adenine(2030)-N(6))-methyltransferase RlmJ [Hyphomicrobiales bacterium]
MNYRHAYHAGNFADVVKHVALLACLDYLQRKDAALCILESHGGAGAYDLASAEAGKTAEWERGLGRLLAWWRERERSGAGALPHALEVYLDAVAGDAAQMLYPGSPLLIARKLRPQDRLIAAELHPPTHAALAETLAPFPAVRPLHMDGYEMLRALLPPPERRGLALVDPPFERRDEFDVLIRQMREWKKRWATGVYLVWHPIKAHLPWPELHEAARNLALPRTLLVEALVAPRDRPETFNGCGVVIWNAPFTAPESLEAALPPLRDALGLYDAALRWLVPPV